MNKRNIKIPGVHKSTGLKDSSLKKIPNINFVYAAIILNSLNFVAVLVLQKNLPPQVPLFYGLTEGEQQLTSSLGLLIPSVYSFCLIIVNTTLSILLNNDFLKKILNTTSFIISLLSIITVAKIIYLVGYF
jgi:hypothetical protein